MIRVIVADDAPFIREIVRQVVERAGMEIVAEAADGEEAIAHTLRFEPHVVFLDLVMPKMNGIEAAKKILAVLPMTKVIAFSTMNQKEIIDQALEAGCCFFLEKPFSAEAVLAAIQKAIRS